MIETELRKTIEDIRVRLPKREIAPENIRSEKEIEREKEIRRKALEIGLDLSVTDGEEISSYYRDRGLLYILQGKEIPKELLREIEKERKEAERKKEKDYEPNVEGIKR